MTVVRFHEQDMKEECLLTSKMLTTQKLFFSHKVPFLGHGHICIFLHISWKSVIIEPSNLDWKALSPVHYYLTRWLLTIVGKNLPISSTYLMMLFLNNFQIFKFLQRAKFSYIFCLTDWIIIMDHFSHQMILHIISSMRVKLIIFQLRKKIKKVLLKAH